MEKLIELAQEVISRRDEYFNCSEEEEELFSERHTNALDKLENYIKDYFELETRR